MSILPTTYRLRGSIPFSSSMEYSFSTSENSNTSGSHLLTYLRRLISPSQMDWEYSSRQMVLLFSSPSKVYELSKYRKSTRDRWARDDPGFLVLLFGFTFMSSFAFGIAFGMNSIAEYALLFFYAFLQVFVFGAFIATITSTVANKRMRITDDMHGVEQHVEWLYAFDIHANAMFPTVFILSVLQYMFLPFLIRPSYVACILSNMLHVVGFIAYLYITHLGYRSMPFLERTQIFLMPAGPILMLCFFMTILDINLTRVTTWFVYG